MKRAASSPDATPSVSTPLQIHAEGEPANPHVTLFSYLHTEVVASIVLTSDDENDREFLEARIESDSDDRVALTLRDGVKAQERLFFMTPMMFRRLPELFAELARRAEYSGLLDDTAEISLTQETRTLSEVA